MDRGLLSLMRRYQWNLTQDQRDNLTRYLETFPVLKSLYLAKQRLNKLLRIKNLTAKHAKKFLVRLLKLIGQFAQSPAKTLANTLTSWIEPIVRMRRFSKSNGITEGFHTKIERRFQVRSATLIN
jgi:transposase